MNRGSGRYFHSAAESSLTSAVNQVWKLCKSWWNRQARPNDTFTSSGCRLVLDMMDQCRKPVGSGVGRDFHFYGSPTVTAGFKGFYFDIREVLKVALPDGRFGLCR